MENIIFVRPSRLPAVEYKKEPTINVILAKGLCILEKEPYMFAKEPYIFTT